MSNSTGKPLKIVYLTPALYMAGGVERVLTQKANYFAEHFGYDITIILTEGMGKSFAYPLFDKIKVINLDINFEELWNCSLVKKIYIYLKKQREYKRKLTAELMRIRPDITDSLLRREINFITEINDGSKKIGELHVNRSNYRNFEANETSWFKELFAKYWMRSLVRSLKKLDRFVVLTEEDKQAWNELDNVVVIHNPLSFNSTSISPLTEKRVIAVGRYAYQKGFDLLLQAWAKVEKTVNDWRLDVFGDGDRSSYERLVYELKIDHSRCQLHGRTNDVEREYVNSSLFVMSSRFEGFGMVITEAMVCGLPVVAFNCPWGPSAIITDGEDGLLVENGHVEALANALVRLMGDEHLRRSMAEAGVRNVQRFSLDSIAQRWKVLFESI